MTVTLRLTVMMAETSRTSRVGASAPLARLPGLATPCPGGGQRVEGRLDSQSAGVCLRLLRVEVGHVCVELRA